MNRYQLLTTISISNVIQIINQTITTINNYY
jgi:hypothetical protein